MRKTLTALVLLASGGPALANEKACIMRAAEILPRIPGLSIEESTVRPLPEKLLATFKGDVPPILVDIRVSAAGQKDTYSYLCVMAGARPLVQRIVE